MSPIVNVGKGVHSRQCHCGWIFVAISEDELDADIKRHATYAHQALVLVDRPAPTESLKRAA